MELDVDGERTEVADLAGHPAADLVLVNDEDLTYAKLRLDERSLATLRTGIGTIPDPLTRALCWSAAWDMTRDAELPAREWVQLVLAGIDAETEMTVVQSLLARVQTALTSYADPSWAPTGWTQLADQQHTTAAMLLWTEANNPDQVTAPGLTAIFSPRRTTSGLLADYATTFDGATTSAHITGAFGLNKVFRQPLGVDRDLVRTVLLDQEPEAGQEIPHTDPDVRVSWGDYLHKVTFEQWAA